MSPTLATRAVLAAALVLSGCARAASAEPSLGRTRVHPRGVDGAMSERAVEVTIDAGGRSTSRERRAWEVLTDYGLDYHADPMVVFDSSRQSLDVAVARSTRADGTVTETPASGRNELLPEELADAPAYAAIRETVVSIVGLEPGSRAELDYTVADREAPPWSAGGIVPVAGPMPTGSLEVRLASSRGTLRSACVRCEVPARQGEEGGAATHSYRFTDLAALDTYELGPGEGDESLPSSLVPRVVYSTAESWEAEARSLAARVEASAQPSEALRARVAELCRDAVDGEGRLEAIQGFVATAVETVHFDLARLGYAPPRAEVVLERSYGSVLDKAVLLLALLRAAGMDGQVVLLSRDSEIAEDVPWLGQLERAWVVTTVGGQELWLPPCRPLVLPRAAVAGDHWALFLGRPGAPVRVDAAAPEGSTARLVADLRLGADRTLAGDLAVSASGRANPYFDLRSRDQGGERALAPAAAAFSGSAEGVTVSRMSGAGTEVRGRLQATLPAEAGGELLAVPLPWPAADPFGALEPREARELPVELGGPGVRASRVAIQLPSGWSPEGLPSTVEIRNEVGWLVQTVTVEGRRVEISRELGLRRRVVEPEAWASLRALLVEADRLGREPLLLVAGAAE